MRLNVGVIFGGKSVEHEISILSAVEMMGYFDTDKYNVIPIYIDKNNDWYTGMHLKDIIHYRDISLVKRYAKKVNLVKSGKSTILQSCGFFKRGLYVIDFIFPIGHGAYLEDGSLQGYLNMLGVPYAGPDVLSSAIGIDKVVQKQLLEFNHIPVCKYVYFYDYEFTKNKKSVLEKINILNQILELFKGSIFRQTMFAEFEKIISEKNENGEILTAEVLNNEYYKLVQKYFGNDIIIDEEIKYEWERIPHFYYDFYVYKYGVGLAAACHIVKEILENPNYELKNKDKVLI